MVEETASEGEAVSSMWGAFVECKAVPVAFPNVYGWGDLSTRSFHSLAQDDILDAAS